jgi:uncharacterized protein YdgA (DUF945 family)
MKKPFWLSVCLLLLCLMAAADSLSGYLIRQELDRATAHLFPASTSITVSTLQSHGWFFRSRVIQHLTFPAPAALQLSSDDTLTLKVTHRIQHGPFVWQWGLSPVLGRITTEIELPDTLVGLMAYHQIAPPDIALTHRIDFDGQFTTRANVSPIHYSGEGSTLVWEGLEAVLRYHSKSDRLDTRLDWGKFYSRDTQFEANISPIQATSSGKVRTATGNRSLTLHLDEFTLFHAPSNEHSLLRQFEASAHYTEADTGFSDITLQTRLDSIHFRNRQFDNGTLAVTLQRLDTATLHQLNRAMNHSLASAQKDNLPPELIQIGLQSLVLQVIPKLLAHRPELSLSFGMLFPEGDAQAKIHLTVGMPNPPVFDDPVAFLEQIEFEGQFSLPKALLQQFVHEFSQSQTDHSTEPGAVGQLNRWAQQRYIVIQNETVSADISLNKGVLQINARHIPLSEVLPPLFGQPE